MHQFLTVIDQTGAVFDLTTVEDVNAELGLTGSTDDDAQTQARITSNSKIIAELCGRVFALQTVRETFRIKGRDSWGDVINLSRYPVADLASLTIGGVEADVSGYEIDYNAGVIYRVHGTWPRASEIIAEYSGGYNLPDGAPAPLARACIEFVKLQQFTAARDPSIRDIWAGENRVAYSDYYQRFGIGGGGSGLPPNVEGLIAPFRRLAV